MYDVSFKVVSLRQILDKWKSLMWTREEGVLLFGERSHDRNTEMIAKMGVALPDIPASHVFGRD
jgi:hypothetical protein